jgi:hypothetical protein
VTISEIQRMVAAYFALPEEYMHQKNQSPQILAVRQFAMALCCAFTPAPLKAIAWEFGAKAHGTVANACDSTARRCADDITFGEAMERFSSVLHAPRPLHFSTEKPRLCQCGCGVALVQSEGESNGHFAIRKFATQACYHRFRRGKRLTKAPRALRVVPDFSGHNLFPPD